MLGVVVIVKDWKTRIHLMKSTTLLLRAVRKRRRRRERRGVMFL